MGEKLITHGLHETLRTFGVEHIVEVLEYGGQAGDDDHDQCYVAEVIAEEGGAAQGVDLLGHHGGKAEGLGADNGVYGGPDDLRDHHFQQSHCEGRQNAQHEKVQAAAQKVFDQRKLCVGKLFGSWIVGLFHENFDLLNVYLRLII